MVSLDLFLSPGLVVNGRDRYPSSSGLVSGFVWFLARLLLTSLCWIGHHLYTLPKAARSPGSKMTLYFVLGGALICILSNCITPSSVISWVKPELPFHSYTARTKKSQMEGDVD